ncbi:hypothetical protein HDC90_002161 [Pedobacter sp. AK013]|nr:hypothetical protein [Pedobacter sp. AK013]
MKNKFNLLTTCCLIISACGSLKSEKTLQTENLQANSLSQAHRLEQSRATANTLLLDTSNSEYVVQITPVGKFRYSAENGFEGMAEKVVVRGKASKRQVMHQQRQIGHQLQYQKHSVESTALKTEVLHMDKSRKPNFGTIGIGLVVVLGLACWLTRKWLFT